MNTAAWQPSPAAAERARQLLEDRVGPALPRFESYGIAAADNADRKIRKRAARHHQLSFDRQNLRAQRFPLASLTTADRRRRGDRASAWRSRHLRNRRPRPVQAAISLTCLRPCWG